MEAEPEVGVVGPGMMGAEIVLCFATTGKEVLLKDSTSELEERGKARLASVWKKVIRKAKFSEELKNLRETIFACCFSRYSTKRTANGSDFIRTRNKKRTRSITAGDGARLVRLRPDITKRKGVKDEHHVDTRSIS